MNKTDVLIIGGGISGLSMAWHLGNRGIETELWEGNQRLGGKIQTDLHDGYCTEQAASMVLNFRPEVSRFLTATGLDDFKVERDSRSAPNRYILHEGRLVPVSSSLLQVMMSPLWSQAGRLRLLAEILVPKGGHAKETVSEFVRRRFGGEMLDKAIEPFVACTLASDPDLANAYTVLPRLTALERRFGRISIGVLAHKLLRKHVGAVREIFSFAGGMSTLIKQLTAKLEQQPSTVLRTSYKVQHLYRSGGGWLVHGDSPDGEQCRLARRVILCTPAPTAAHLLSTVDARLQELLKGIDYCPMSVLHLGFDRAAIEHSLDGTGFLVPRSAKMSISGNLWTSSTFENRAPAGKALLSCYIGGARNPETLALDDGQIIDRALDDLDPLIGIRENPEMTHIVRHQQALPLYHGAYFERCQAISERLAGIPGLHLLANYHGGVSIRDRLAASMIMGHVIGESLQPQSTRHSICHLGAPIAMRD